MIKCKSYTIFINEWQSLRAYIDRGDYSSTIVIVDEHTKVACLPTLRKEIDREFQIIEIKSGEQNKNLSTCEAIWDTLIEYGADRHSLCINLGGGVIGDMGGFTAATFMRGMDFIQIPTTLLSQVDASVGGKLGIDYHEFKNLIGIIKDPEAVFIFTDFLMSLPYKQLLSGYSELIKHGLIADRNVYEKLSSVISLEAIDWTPIVTESVNIKKNVTEQDPEERGLRKILNFGHTLGHAIESINLPKEKPLLHGEAIAIGMIMESHLSYQKNYLSLEECNIIKKNMIKLYGHHPEKIPELELLIPIMKKDKKNKGGNISFTLLEKIGKATYDNIVENQEIAKALDFYIEVI